MDALVGVLGDSTGKPSSMSDGLPLVLIALSGALGGDQTSLRLEGFFHCCLDRVIEG
jgi:predicted DNA-binding ribbon-helix-helix protein